MRQNAHVLRGVTRGSCRCPWLHLCSQLATGSRRSLGGEFTCRLPAKVEAAEGPGERGLEGDLPLPSVAVVETRARWVSVLSPPRRAALSRAVTSWAEPRLPPAHHWHSLQAASSAWLEVSQGGKMGTFVTVSTIQIKVKKLFKKGRHSIVS